ncbi:MAG: response regulator [Bacteroidota bacterium]
MTAYISAEVLLVEDNQYDAELTLRAFRKQGLVNKIFHATDGEDALDFLFCRGKYEARKNSAHVKVILLDLKLPKIHGLEVLKEIKSRPETSKIPVVVVSSSSEDPDIKKAYALGANSYVVKPVEFENFMKSLQNTGMYWLLVNHVPEK